MLTIYTNSLLNKTIHEEISGPRLLFCHFCVAYRRQA